MTKYIQDWYNEHKLTYCLLIITSVPSVSPETQAPQLLQLLHAEYPPWTEEKIKRCDRS